MILQGNSMKTSKTRKAQSHLNCSTEENSQMISKKQIYSDTHTWLDYKHTHTHENYKAVLLMTSNGTILNKTSASRI